MPDVVPLTPQPALPRRILIIRLSALGDIVFATTLLHGLRKAFPQAEIDWLTQPEYRSFLQSQPGLTQVLTWARKDWTAWLKKGRWLALFRAIRDFRRALRARDYDWVIDGQGLFKARLLAWLAGGRFRAGPSSKEPGRFLMHAILERPPGDLRMGWEHRAYLRQLVGQDGEAPRLFRPVGEHARPLPPGAVILVPFTTRPQKHWPETHWVELIQRLHARGLPLVMLGGPGDREAAGRILGALPQGVTVDDRVGATGIVDAVRLIADARAVVGMDTGLTHMGIALDKPTVGIFGSTLPYRDGGRAPMAIEWLGLPCSPCKRRPTCGGVFMCLRDLTPERIEATLLRVMAETTPSG